MTTHPINLTACHINFSRALRLDDAMQAELVRLFGKEACNRRYDRACQGWSERAKRLLTLSRRALNAWRKHSGYSV